MTPAEATARVLLVWDAPNLDMGLGSILGGRPTAAHRPRFDALGRWLLARTAELSRAGARPDVSLEPEATVFTNIAPGSADVVRPWVEALRNVGFAVFAKPKIDEDSDVDSDMLNHIALRRSEGLAGVLVASADGQAFKQPLEEIARRRHPRPGARISRTCQLGVSVGYLGVRRPGGHSWCFPGTATANRPRFAARAGGLAAAVPAAVLATDLARVDNWRLREVAYRDFELGAYVFAWWGRTVYRYRYIVIGVMVALCLGGGVFGISLGQHVTQSGFYDDGSESVQASVIADEAYGRDSSGHIIAIYTAPDGKKVDDPAFQKTDPRRPGPGRQGPPRPDRAAGSAASRAPTVLNER